MNKDFRTLLLMMFLLSGICAIAIGGSVPDGYWEHSIDYGTPFPYQIEGVISFSLIALAEFSLIYLILRPKTYCQSWQSALVSFILLLAISAYWGLWLMHAPNYMVAHFVWLLAGCILLLALALSSGVQRVRNAHNK